MSKARHNGEKWVEVEDSITISLKDFETLISYAEWAYSDGPSRVARQCGPFLERMKAKLDPEEPEVEWVTVVPLNSAPFVATHFDLNEDDDTYEYEDEEETVLLVGWKWNDRKRRTGTWKELLSYARSKKAEILLPGGKVGE